MAHYAKIYEGVVVEVIVADSAFIKKLEGEWVQTSYNTYGNEHKKGGKPLRGNFAGIGYMYDRENDVFYTPQPFNSWSLNKGTWLWEAPVKYPDDGKIYVWNEGETKWDLSQLDVQP
jgi:hypothetical protein